MGERWEVEARNDTRPGDHEVVRVRGLRRHAVADGVCFANRTGKVYWIRDRRNDRRVVKICRPEPEGEGEG